MVHERNNLLIFIHDIAVIFKRCINARMSQQCRYFDQRNLLLYQDRRVHMPLRYNKDKSETPLLPRLLKCLKARKRYYIQKNLLI